MHVVELLGRQVSPPQSQKLSPLFVAFLLLHGVMTRLPGRESDKEEEQAFQGDGTGPRPE